MFGKGKKAAAAAAAAQAAAEAEAAALAAKNAPPPHMSKVVDVLAQYPPPEVPDTQDAPSDDEKDIEEQLVVSAVLSTHKNAEPVGTWDSEAFQLFAGAAVGQFDTLGYLCVPHVGLYGEDYAPRALLLAASLPCSLSTLARQLVPPAYDAVKGLGNIPIQLYFLVHAWAPPGPCGKLTCDNLNEVNLMYHCWAYPDVLFNVDTVCNGAVDLGVFDDNGVQAVHQLTQDSGAAFGALAPRSVVMHAGCFSPANCQIQFKASASVASFVTVAVHRPRMPASESKADAEPTTDDDSPIKAAVTLHVLPITDDAEVVLRGATTAKNLVGVINALTDLSVTKGGAYTAIYEKVKRLFSVY